MSYCRVWFRSRGMRARVFCDLQDGHASRYHQREFRTWTARVWPRDGAKPMRFRYFAKPGQRLPKSVCR